MDLNAVCSSLRAASVRLAQCTAEEKNRALLSVASSIRDSRPEILSANALDVGAPVRPG
jgi:gamma-glutamyl phosphate reductase